MLEPSKVKSERPAGPLEAQTSRDCENSLFCKVFNKSKKSEFVEFKMSYEFVSPII